MQLECKMAAPSGQLYTSLKKYYKIYRRFVFNKWWLLII